MTSLPIFQTSDRTLSMLQTSWQAAITPVLQNELNQGILISNITLNNGVTVINHLLGRNQIGWMITDINAAATIYRSAVLNPNTLTLTSNAACVVSIWMF